MQMYQFYFGLPNFMILQIVKIIVLRINSGSWTYPSSLLIIIPGIFLSNVFIP